VSTLALTAIPPLQNLAPLEQNSTASHCQGAENQRRSTTHI
jgi:hypothetical protein